MYPEFDTEKMLARNLEIWNAADPTVRYSKVKSFENVLDEQNEWENRYGMPWWQ